MSKSSKNSNILELLLIFVLWYSFNAGYNVYNAYNKADYLILDSSATKGGFMDLFNVSNIVPVVVMFPWMMSIFQLVIGLFYSVPLWLLGIREMPALTFDDYKTLFPITFCNSIGHVATIAAMCQKGGGSFTHVIKASEPVFSVILTALVDGKFPKPLAGLSLLPITYGVAYASTLGNLSIDEMVSKMGTTTSKLAILANCCFCMRSILKSKLKNIPGFIQRTNLNPDNEFTVATISTLALILPFAIYMEIFGKVCVGDDPSCNTSVSFLDVTGSMSQEAFYTFIFNTFVCGFCWYMYNECQNKVLDKTGAITMAVGNTLKRVVIFVALYFFTEGETFPPAKILGSAIAVIGCLSYALLK